MGLFLDPKVRNDRPLDRRPTQDRCTILSKRCQVLLSNVTSSIEISIELIATGATVKHGLRTTIHTMLIATLATGLAGMARVDLDDADTSCLRFVLDKRVQLGE